MNLSSIGAPLPADHGPYGRAELNEQLLANVNDCLSQRELLRDSIGASLFFLPLKRWSFEGVRNRSMTLENRAIESYALLYRGVRGGWRGK